MILLVIIGPWTVAGHNRDSRIPDALARGQEVAGPRCRGEISLEPAQHEIATDWIAAYERYIGQAPVAEAR
jgi:hypothetical protein